MADETLKATGGCMCGDVRYEVRGESVWKATCYCPDCCRAVGAPAVAWAGFKTSCFKVLKGSLTRYVSSPGVVRRFCGRCGTSLTYEQDPGKARVPLPVAPGEIYVTTMSLDDPEAFPPDEHVLYSHRVAWFHVADDLPRREAPDRSE